MDYPRYDPASPITPLTAAELDGLDQLLQALPAEACMSLDGTDGFLTALQVGPAHLLATLETAEWLPLVWGGDGPGGAEEATPFASKRQRKATVVLLLRHLRHLADQLDHRPARLGAHLQHRRTRHCRMGRCARLVHRLPASRGPDARRLGRCVHRPRADPAAATGRRLARAWKHRRWPMTMTWPPSTCKAGRCPSPCCNCASACGRACHRREPLHAGWPSPSPCAKLKDF
jgi:hypothetical protein